MFISPLFYISSCLNCSYFYIFSCLYRLFTCLLFIVFIDASSFFCYPLYCCNAGNFPVVGLTKEYLILSYLSLCAPLSLCQFIFVPCVKRASVLPSVSFLVSQLMSESITYLISAYSLSDLFAWFLTACLCTEPCFSKDCSLISTLCLGVVHLSPVVLWLPVLQHVEILHWISELLDLLVVREEKTGDHQSNQDSSFGDHGNVCTKVHGPT